MITTQTALRDIVADNFNTASVLEKYGLDFCCKGGISLSEACRTKNINLEKVTRELSLVKYEEASQRYSSWDLPYLIDYIISNHHSYVKNQIPLINLHLEKVARTHGDNHPEIKEAAAIFTVYGKSLEHHMMKEENILFPFIKALAHAYSTGEEMPTLHFGSIDRPIAIMREEHADVGKELAHIRDLLHNYSPPDDACTTMRLLYQELDAFEQDLHKHVFLENATLFPKAIRMEKELSVI